MTTHYSILGISPNATAKEIKTSYYQLAKAHHPDVDGDEVIFKQIVEAYEVLSNPTKRNKYDQELYYSGQLTAKNKQVKRDALWVYQQIEDLKTSFIQTDSNFIDGPLMVAYIKQILDTNAFLRLRENPQYLKKCINDVKDMSLLLHWHLAEELFFHLKSYLGSEDLNEWILILHNKRKVERYHRLKPLLIIIIASIVAFCIYWYGKSN